MELWNLPAADGIFLPGVSSLNDTADQYPNCDDGSIGSVGLMDNRLNTATVAYYSGITTGSTACFVCDVESEYELNSTITRVCQPNGLWSSRPITCGMFLL